MTVLLLDFLVALTVLYEVVLGVQVLLGRPLMVAEVVVSAVDTVD